MVRLICMARILVGEDDPTMLEFYGELLKEEGFSVDLAADGEEALKFASQGGYDLILLDVHLPKKEGPQILEELSQNPPSTPNKKIIMLTNVTHETAIEEQTKNLGASKFLLKSALTPDQFLEEVKLALS